MEVNDVCWAGREITTYAIIKETSTDFAPVLPASLWLLSLSIEGKSKKTVETYGSAICQFLRDMTDIGNGQKGWKELDDRDFNAYFYAYLNQSRKLSVQTLNVYAAAIDGFYTWAYSNGFLTKKIELDDLLVGCKKVKSQGGKFRKSIGDLSRLYMDENKFISLLEKNKEKNPFIQERNNLVLKMGYYLGMRANEVVQGYYLNTEMLRKVVPDKHTSASLTITINGKGNKNRQVNIPPTLVNDIRRFLYGRRAELSDGPLISTVIGDGLDRQFPSKLFRKLADEMDDDREAWRDRSFHVLRKCFATNLVSWCYEKGIDPWVLVVERLGHDSLNTTRVYIFFEALMNKRQSVISKLSLENSSYRNIWGKGNG